MRHIEIFVMTSKRARWCHTLLEDLKEQGSGFDYDVRIFHDNCGNDYSGVEQFCNENSNFHYYKTKEHLGKEGFWMLHNLMYTFLDTLHESEKVDYFIQLPDDIVLVNDFFKRAITLVQNDVHLCNFFTFQIHKKIYQGAQTEITKNGVKMWANNWVDCCFVAKGEYMKGIRIDTPDLTRWLKNKRLGSGVAHSFIRAWRAKYDKTIYETVWALIEHWGGFGESAMHAPERKICYYGEVPAKKYEKGLKYRLLGNLHPNDVDYIYDKVTKLVSENKL